MAMAAMARARKQKAAAAAAAKRKAAARKTPSSMGGVVDIAMANKDLLRKQAAKAPARKPDKWDAHLKASKLEGERRKNLSAKYNAMRQYEAAQAAKKKEAEAAAAKKRQDEAARKRKLAEQAAEKKKAE